MIRQIKSRRMRWAGHVVRMVEEMKVYKVLVGKPKGKSPLGRPRRRGEDEIRMDLRKIGGGVERIQLAQDRGRWRPLVNTVIYLRVLATRSPFHSFKRFPYRNSAFIPFLYHPNHMHSASMHPRYHNHK
jgi:hypothetical protein